MVFSSVSLWAHQEPKDSTQKPTEAQEKEKKIKVEEKHPAKKKKKEANYFPFLLFPVIGTAYWEVYG